ncbi:hypothetical protein COC58_30130, partial [Bacillus cereus]|uniref:condensation domain-containing protein n=1 Tax=Bacillus cereus TaxID=1396 RepID=UPI000C032758
GNLEIEGLKFRMYKSNVNSEKFKMTITAIEELDGIYFKISCASRVFHKESVERIAEYFTLVIRHVIDDIDVEIGKINILTLKELEFFKKDLKMKSAVLEEEFNFDF